MTHHFPHLYNDPDFDKADVLKTRYREQAAHLRDFNQYELRVVGGYLTIQLLLAGWFSSHPPTGLISAAGTGVIDLVLFISVCVMLTRARRRRMEVVGTIQQINEALGLYEAGTYLPGKAIDERRANAHLKIDWYLIPCFVAFLGVLLTLAAVVSQK